jgi:hypothetical protein
VRREPVGSGWEAYFDEVLSSDNSQHELSLSIWEEEPVEFRDFVESPEYLGAKALSKKQYEMLAPIVSFLPKKILTDDRAVNLLVLLLGKGSGKGYMTIVLEAYVAYLLLCLRDPVGFFNLAGDTFLDMVNVALREKQAELNYFDRFKALIKKSPYFTRNYRIMESGGRRVNRFSTPKRGDIFLGSLVVKFPKRIRAVAVPSKADSFEGGTVIFFVMDEASGFKSEKGLYTADSLFSSLITSTRNLPYIGIVSSFVRLDEAHDFTYKKYVAAINEQSPTMVGFKYPPWEVLPELYGEPDTDLVINRRTGETIKVPQMFASLVDEGKLSLDDFKARYLCVPYGAGGGGERFVELSVSDWELLITEKSPAVLAFDEVVPAQEDEGSLLRKHIQFMEQPKLNTQYFLSLDASESHADTVLVLGHPERRQEAEGMGVLLVVDAILVWHPDAEQGITVDLFNVMEVIAAIHRNYRVQLVRMDHWNAAMMEQGLRHAGVIVRRSPQTLQEYRLMAGYFESLAVELPRCDEVELLKSQLFLLKPRGNSKPKPLFGKQDVIDALVGLVGAIHDRLPNLRPVGNRRQMMGTLMPRSEPLSPTDALRRAMLEKHGISHSLGDFFRRTGIGGRSRMGGSVGKRGKRSLEKGGF